MDRRYAQKTLVTARVTHESAPRCRARACGLVSDGPAELGPGNKIRTTVPIVSDWFIRLGECLRTRKANDDRSVCGGPAKRLQRRNRRPHSPSSVRIKSRFSLSRIGTVPYMPIVRTDSRDAGHSSLKAVPAVFPGPDSAMIITRYSTRPPFRSRDRHSDRLCRLPPMRSMRSRTCRMRQRYRS